MINSHPQVVCTHEFGLDRLLAITDQLFDAEREQQRQLAALQSWPDEVKMHWFSEGTGRKGRLHIEDRFLVPRKARDMEAILKAFFSAISNKRGIKVAGDKLPNAHNQTIWDIRESGRRVKSIQIVRHPISVIESSLERANNTALVDDTWHVSTLDEAIDEWITNWEKTAIRAADGHKDDLFVRYEDLCDDFTKEATRIARHLGIIDGRFKNIVDPNRSDWPRRRLSNCEIDHLHNRIGGWLHTWRDASVVDQLLSYRGMSGPSCSVQDTISIEDGSLQPDMIVRGFSEPEPPTGIWTNAKQAQVRYRLADVPQDSMVNVTLQFYPFNNGSGAYSYAVKFFGGKKKTLTGKIGSEAVPIKRRFPCMLQNGYIDFTIYIRNPKLPEGEPIGDTRRLGLKLKAISHQILS